MTVQAMTGAQLQRPRRATEGIDRAESTACDRPGCGGCREYSRTLRQYFNPRVPRQHGVTVEARSKHGFGGLAATSHQGNSMFKHLGLVAVFTPSRSQGYLPPGVDNCGQVS